MAGGFERPARLSVRRRGVDLLDEVAEELWSGLVRTCDYSLCRGSRIEGVGLDYSYADAAGRSGRESRAAAVDAGIAPFVLLAGAYIVLMWIWRVTQPGYKDIRFTVSAAWPLVTLYSLW